MEKALEARRGGRAVMFIYIAVFFICAPVGTALKVPPYYLWIAIGLLAVVAGTFLPAYIFNKPVIKADSEGLWTSKTGLLNWGLITDIRMERSEKSPFSTSVANTELHLCIETANGDIVKFNLLYLNVNYNTFPETLKSMWQKYIKNEDRATT